MRPYRFVFTHWFKRTLRRLGKRNPHIRADFEAFIHHFDAEAHPVIPGTGGARKARMKVTGRGKSGGYRVIYYLFSQDTVWFITVYDKVQTEDLSPAEKARVIELVQEIKRQVLDE
jgi:mRNA-degrading endonuclease RelE of RelBE toxin-antitoxin system